MHGVNGRLAGKVAIVTPGAVWTGQVPVIAAGLTTTTSDGGTATSEPARIPTSRPAARRDG
jgi:hypothetical protein